MRPQNGLFVVVALCRGGCRFFAVCFKLHFSTFTMKTNEKPTKQIHPWVSLVVWKFLLPSPLAVPCGLASAASFVCVVIVSSLIANPHGREGAGMMSFGLFGGLEGLPALAVPCGLASAASFVCFVFYRQSPCQ